ncbi:MAG: methyltransferase domain-containing protein [Planctomycetes bacterium]|nr:methyltransferase domain-containing protein [Planctomycetota bacterium]
MPSTPPPQWQLPPGITRGLWEYVNSDAVAYHYDEYFSHNQLFEFDERIVIEELSRRKIPAGAVVADLGCGTGRALVTLAGCGYRGLAIDLSQKMLEVVREKAEDASLPIQCIQANWVELDGIADSTANGAISLFSTLGMIRGKENRAAALAHTRRILEPGGPFVLHVHNYWYNLYDPGGPWWVLRTLCRAIFKRDIEAGDKFFPYRGVPNMFLHVFRLRELKRDLRRAGFRITRIIALAPQRYRKLRASWFFGTLRANGWIVVCE